MKFNKKYMENMISRCYPEEGLSKIPRESLNYTKQTNGDWTPIKEVLAEWQARGVATLVKDPETANDDEICIVMKSFFNGMPFPLHWIRDK